MTIKATCATCGEEFIPRRSGGKAQVRCSAQCRRTAATAAYVARHAPERTTICVECGGPVIQPQRGRPRRFCSAECKARAGNRRQRRARLPLKDPAPEARICPVCGVSFLPKKRDRLYCYDGYCNQKSYANRKATGDASRVNERIVTCDGCRETFTARHPTARWCSKACANRHWGNVRARQRGTLSSARYTDREIFERDGWICHICQKPVNRVAPRLNPDGASIDHIQPLCRGGLDEPDNVATAHWRCNREKGST